MAHDREVAGLRCTEVLARLGDYLEDALEAGVRGQIDAHLAGCDWCERFGGEYAGTVGALRKVLREGDVDGGIAERLERRLETEDETDPG